jgi:hypothetical protein
MVDPDRLVICRDWAMPAEVTAGDTSRIERSVRKRLVVIILFFVCVSLMPLI